MRAALPSAPTNVTATRIDATNARISWTAATGATSYEVEWRTGTNAWRTSVDYRNNTATSYTSAGMGQQEYTFRVRSVNSAGKSNWVECRVDMRTVTITLPRPSVTVRGNSVTITWASIRNVSDVVLGVINTDNPMIFRTANVSGKTSHTFDNLSGSFYAVLSPANWITGVESSERVFFTVGTAIANGTITIQYDANGGSSAPSSHSVTKDNNGAATARLSLTIPRRNGFTFLGWRLNNRPENPLRAPGESVTYNTGNASTSTTEVYFAQWSENPPDTPRYTRPSIRGAGSSHGLQTLSLTLLYPTANGNLPPVSAISEIGYIVTNSNNVVVYNDIFTNITHPSEHRHIIQNVPFGSYTVVGYVVINGIRYDSLSSNYRVIQEAW
jgi:hypothetical protein